MSRLFWFVAEQLERIKLVLSKERSISHAVDREVLGGIAYIIKKELI
jgi:hypothetical protein